MKLSEVAHLLSGTLEGDEDVEVTDIARIDSAGPEDVTFISNPVYEKFFYSTQAAAVIVSRNFNPDSRPHIERRKVPLIRVDDPYIAFTRLLDIFRPKTELQEIGIHETAVISETADISSQEVRIGANVFIGERVVIGSRTIILPNTVILAGARIGDDCLIYPLVTIYPGCIIGNSVIIHSSTVIGSDGFGQARNPDGTFEKIPQRGIVVIGDGSEIGSACTIDRATIGETVIGRGVKLDNQIQIAHNVIIGDNTVIAAQTGIAGSTKIGKNCMIGGKVGIVGHIEICDNVTITAATNVSKSIKKPGIYSGYRAQPQQETLRQEALLRSFGKKRK